MVVSRKENEMKTTNEKPTETETTKKETTMKPNEDTAIKACRRARNQIAHLKRMLDETLENEMHEAGWDTAGSLGHVADLLAQAVGFLRGVEGDQIISDLNAKMNRVSQLGR